MFLPKVEELRRDHEQPSAPFLIIVDNHGSRKDIEFLTLCSRNNIIVFTLPANCTFVLQPLDLSFNGIFQINFNKRFQAPKSGAGVAGERTALFTVACDAYYATCQQNIILGVPDSRARVITHPSFIDELTFWEANRNSR